MYFARLGVVTRKNKAVQEKYFQLASHFRVNLLALFQADLLAYYLHVKDSHLFGGGDELPEPGKNLGPPAFIWWVRRLSTLLMANPLGFITFLSSIGALTRGS